MSDLVVVTGDFSSGTTLLFTLFRATERYRCLYEPFHEKLLEYLVWPLRVDERHFHVRDYFAEYRGLRRLPDLFDPKWGTSRLHLDPGEDAPELHRYLAYLIGGSYGRSPRVLLQFNRAAFRLGWLRRQFPRSRVVHVWRDREDQWESIVRRVQRHLGREDVGQSRVDFRGFNIATWCDDLAPVYPELEAGRSSSGFERFSKLWALSKAEQERHADISVRFRELTQEFESTFDRVRRAVGGDFPVVPLRSLVAGREVRRRPPIRGKSRGGLAHWIDRLGRRFAREWVRWRSRG